MAATGVESFPRVDLDASFAVPEKKINSDADVLRFQHSVAFARVMAFIELLNGSIKGKTCLDDDIPSNPAVLRVIDLLDVLNGYIEEVPPSTGPRRFGNVAFRTWMKRVEEVRNFAEWANSSREHQCSYGNIFHLNAMPRLSKRRHTFWEVLDQGSVWIMGLAMNFLLPHSCVRCFYCEYWIPQRTRLQLHLLYSPSMFKFFIFS